MLRVFDFRVMCDGSIHLLRASHELISWYSRCLNYATHFRVKAISSMHHLLEDFLLAGFSIGLVLFTNYIFSRIVS